MSIRQEVSTDNVGSADETEGGKKRRAPGNFRRKKNDPAKINIDDFVNPWNFYNLFMQAASVIEDWGKENGLLAKRIPCDLVPKKGKYEGTECGGIMTIGPRGFRCKTNHYHEARFRMFSFFEGAHILMNDVMLFIKSYLDGCSLKQCSQFAGISYGSSAVDWGHHIRELFTDTCYQGN